MLLGAAADEARTSVRLLTTYLDSMKVGGPPPALSDFAESRRRQKQNRERIIEELNTSLMPPFDREDIQALAFALYRISKLIEKLVERLSIFPGGLPVAAFQRQAEFLTTAADALVFMVKQLRSGVSIDRISQANVKLQVAEGEADKTMLRELQQLYRSEHEAKELIILHALYQLMERAVDRCRDAGNVVVQIALKNA